jgi:hypothetical protein
MLNNLLPCHSDSSFVGCPSLSSTIASYKNRIPLLGAPFLLE